jgi:hypothetical protein
MKASPGQVEANTSQELSDEQTTATAPRVATRPGIMKERLTTCGPILVVPPQIHSDTRTGSPG